MVVRDTAIEVDTHDANNVLVDASWLQNHLHDPNLRIVEVDVSPAAYNEWHIEGAALWNVYRDLKDAEYRPVDKAAIERLLARSGIESNSTVVFYGYAPAIGFWLLKLYGHNDARILDCGRTSWRDDGRPWTDDVSTPAATVYSLPDADEKLRTQQAEVEMAIGDPTCTILDVRTGPEYLGERFWPSGGLEESGRAGHIPSAVNISLDGLYDESGSFRSAADLRRLFPTAKSFDDKHVITYCTIGGRASTAWFVLTYLLGRKHVSVYDGSWAEWGLLRTAPVVSA